MIGRLRAQVDHADGVSRVLSDWTPRPTCPGQKPHRSDPLVSPTHGEEA
jgi:hypothetical protein